MSLLTVGSVALDSVRTPFGQADEVLGGSATYFSVAASYFCDVSMVAVVGEDFPQRHIDVLKAQGVNLDGLKRVSGKTFRWQGEYSYDLNEAKTLKTELNVFDSFRPAIPKQYSRSKFVFLANIDPELQLNVLEQIENPALVACDTMNFWIEGKKESLLRAISAVNLVIINEAETRELAGEANTVKACKKILALGPRAVIVKRGEYGALMVTNGEIFFAPGYPLESIIDPTGAGDSFAGGLMGYLAAAGRTDEVSIRQGIIFGSVMASFNVEDFSLDGLLALSFARIEKRYNEFKRLVHFEGFSASSVQLAFKGLQSRGAQV